jgi:hypothetical protein
MRLTFKNFVPITSKNLASEGLRSVSFNPLVLNYRRGLQGKDDILNYLCKDKAGRTTEHTYLLLCVAVVGCLYSAELKMEYLFHCFMEQVR